MKALPSLLVLGLAACHGSAKPAPAEAAVADASVTPTSAPTSSAASEDAGAPRTATDRDREAFRAYNAAMARGRLAVARREYFHAMAAFDVALSNVPGDARALADRGYARFKDDDLENAERDLEAARARTARKGLLAQIWLNLGRLAAKRKDAHDAAVAFRQSNALAPNTAAAKKASGKVVCDVEVTPMDRVAEEAAGWDALSDAGARRARCLDRCSDGSFVWHPEALAGVARRPDAGACSPSCEGPSIVVSDPSGSGDSHFALVLPEEGGKLLVFEDFFAARASRCGVGGASFRIETGPVVHVSVILASSYAVQMCGGADGGTETHECDDRPGEALASIACASSVERQDSFFDRGGKREVLRLVPVSADDDIRVAAGADGVDVTIHGCQERLPYGRPEAK